MAHQSLCRLLDVPRHYVKDEDALRDSMGHNLL